MLKLTGKSYSKNDLFTNREQIDEKKMRLKSKISTQRELMVDDFKTKTNSNQIIKVRDENSSVVTRSRYSITNTACTRNLFTPSEDNCLSQHLANYSNQSSGRVISSSDLANLRPSSSKRLNLQEFSEVQEEGSKEENASPIENRVGSVPNQKQIMIEENPEKPRSSIIELEGYVRTLLKEQEHLKSRLKEQERKICDLVKPDDSQGQRTKVCFDNNCLDKIY